MGGGGLGRAERLERVQSAKKKREKNVFFFFLIPFNWYIRDRGGH